MLARLGGIYTAIKWLFYLSMPFIITHFLYKLSQIIAEKYKRAYRDGLNDLAVKSFYQLVKIKMLSSKSEEWKFIGSYDL